jgi:hypothetical protein
MPILCDTSSILMLIRIAPAMFTDSRFDCITLPEVRAEIFGTQKFKTKYPWREHFQGNIVALTTTGITQVNSKFYVKAVKNLVESGVINDRTGQFFNLSRVDQRIAALVVAAEYTVSTGDRNLADFLKQEFERENISALGIVTKWLAAGLIAADARLEAIIEDWANCAEHAQPRADIAAFERIGGIRYPGP